MLKAVLFDFDETLYDHQHACRMAIGHVRDTYVELQQRSLDELERDFWYLLDRMHYEVLAGTMTQEQARRERYRHLFAGCGVQKSEEELEAIATLHYTTYGQNQRAIPGTNELLQHLRQRGVKIIVITNGLLRVQQGKLRDTGLGALIDHLITSEEVGVIKPDPQIFHRALQLCEARPEEVLMIGDSWDNDIVGAHGMGIRAVWFNRRATACPDPSMAHVIEELSQVLPFLTSFIDGSQS